MQSRAFLHPSSSYKKILLQFNIIVKKNHSPESLFDHRVQPIQVELCYTILLQSFSARHFRVLRCAFLCPSSLFSENRTWNFDVRNSSSHRGIDEYTVINRCVIGSCQVNVLVSSSLVIAALSFSTQDEAIWFRLRGAENKEAQQGPVWCEEAALSLTVQSGCIFDGVQMTAHCLLIIDGKSFQPCDPRQHGERWRMISTSIHVETLWTACFTQHRSLFAHLKFFLLLKLKDK